MNEAKFDKRLELLFGLQYYIKRKYGVQFDWICENYKEYNDKFYDLCDENISKEFEDYILNGGLQSYGRCADIALHMDDNYNIIERDTLDEVLLNDENVNINKLEVYIREFVKSTNYDEFIKSNDDYYNFVIKKFYETLNCYKKVNINEIIDFYGYKKGEMNVLLLNFSKGSYGQTYKGDSYYIYGVKNISKVEGEFLLPDGIFINLYHEFSHPYINPLGKKYYNENKLIKLFIESKNYGLSSCYNNSLTVLNEYVVRAVSIYLAKDALNTDMYYKAISNNIRVGFPHIEEVILLLDKRKDYNNFEDFYREVIYKYFIKLFENFSKDD